ncbi:WSC domain-containing protein [Diplocarpon rosae]|nr:WSC domain-containing protein [Diplocarpon rosae]
MEPKPEVKAVDPTVGGILDAVSKVAAALLNDGSDVANLAQGLTSSTSPVSVVSDSIQSVNSGLNQATGIVGSIVSAATGIVGSLMSNPVNVGATFSKTIGTGVFISGSGNSTQAGVTNASLPVNLTSALPLNITSAPNLSGTSLLTAAPSATCPSVPRCTACPAPRTETCTVTETWHSTHYEETATFFNFVAASTVTFTETVSLCPVSKVYPSSPASTSPQSGFVACADGVLARRTDDCPPASTVSNNTTASPLNGSAPGEYDGLVASAHPCPNAGYSCSECPDGVFCPPPQTAAQTCPCGYGWACGNCEQGWFCVPSPTAGVRSGLVSSVASAFGRVNLLSSGTTALSSSVPTTMASFTASRPSLTSIPPLLPSVGLDTDSLQAFRTSPNGFSQATGANVASSVLSDVIGDVNSALENINGLSGAVLSSVMEELSSAVGAANSAIGNANPTIIAAVTAAGGGLLSSSAVLAGGFLSSGAVAGSNAAGVLVPTATSLVGDAAGGLVPSATAMIGSLAGTLQPVSISGLSGEILSGVGAVPQSTGLPNAATPLTDFASGLTPEATAVIGSAAEALESAGIPGLTGAILSSVIGALQSAGLSGLNVPQTQPSVAIPVLNTLGGLFRQVAQPASETKDEPNIISHFTATIQGTPTVLPVVITVLNGQPTVVPLVKLVVDGAEKDVPVVGVDIGATGERARVGAVTGIFNEAGSSGKRRRNRIGDGEGGYLR